MKTYINSVVVNAPIDFVFRYINDDEHIKKWSNGFIKNEYYKPEDKDNGQAGLKFKQFIQIGRQVYEVDAILLEHNPPFKTGVSVKTSNGNQNAIYELSENEGNTKIKLTTQIYYSNSFYKLVDLLFGWFQSFLLKQTMNKMKKVIEENYR